MRELEATQTNEHFFPRHVRGGLVNVVFRDVYKNYYYYVPEFRVCGGFSLDHNRRRHNIVTR